MPNDLKLLIAFQHLNEPFSSSSLPERIIGQKKTYFIQEYGFDLGYRFRWYIYGPYSFDLGSQAFELAALYPPDQMFGISLSSADTASLGKIRNFFDEVKRLPSKGSQIDTERFWLELASSVHFLIHKAVPPARTMQEVSARIRKEKPEYNGVDVRIALVLLKKNHLVKSDFA